jgi:thiol:disulfide interchange protein DsbD
LGSLTAAFALCLGLLSPAARAQVQASLVSADASVQPGKPVTVALHFVHEPHWHTYWINPGTGLATSLTWALPPGWTAGDIEWPVPHVLKDSSGSVVGNGYEGDLFLPVVLTPPADLKPGTTVELKATADWLMCQDSCVPGEQQVSLSLPVSASPPAPDPTWGSKLRSVVAALPRADSSWDVSASISGKTVTLTVKAKGASPYAPKDLHFFADDGLVAYDQPQVVKEDGKGGFVLTLPVGDDGPKNPKTLIGILASENGWRADGTLPGLRVNTAFGGAGGAVAGTVQAGSSGTTPAGTPSAPADADTAGLGAKLFFAFLGGLILNLMPCVFPVLGIKILGFVNQAGTSPAKVAAHGLVFSLGVLISFWVLAGALLVLRSTGSQIGWGFQLQSPGFIFALAALMLVFALNLSGLFEFGMAATGLGANLQAKGGFSGSFFTGVLATVVATPCSGPFLAAALGAALAMPVLQSLSLFTAIAIGLSTPYLLLSIFPSAVRFLPRPGAWMETFKQLMAFPLYATVGWLLWVLAAQVQDYGLLYACFGLVAIAMGAWIYGRWRTPGSSAGRMRFGLAGGLVLLAAGAWLGWPRAQAPTDVVWQPWSEEAVSKLRSEGRIVYVDFTARWCATCQANKKIVFHSDDVLKTFKDKHIATLRGDWTNQDPKITAELAKYQRSAVPFNLIWMPGKDQPIILPSILTPSTVLNALKS